MYQLAPSIDHAVITNWFNFFICSVLLSDEGQWCGLGPQHISSMR